MKKTLLAIIAILFVTTAYVVAQPVGSSRMGPEMMTENLQRRVVPNQEYLRHMQNEVQNNMMSGAYGMMEGYGNTPMMGRGYGTPPCVMGGGYNMMSHSGMMPMMGGYGMMAGPGFMGGPGMMQTQGFEELKKYETFAKETKDLRKKLHDLMFDYGEARWNPATTIGDLNKMAEEMNKLRQEIQEKMPQ